MKFDFDLLDCILIVLIGLVYGWCGFDLVGHLFCLLVGGLDFAEFVVLIRLCLLGFCVGFRVFGVLFLLVFVGCFVCFVI